MAINRRTRDEILHRGLDKADCPTVNSMDRPGSGGQPGPISPQAKCLDWLQDALDYIYEVYPWGGLLTSGALSLTSSGSVTAPTDMAIEVRDGIVLDASKIRLYQVDGQEAVARRMQGDTGSPSYYYVQGSTIYYFPVPTATLAATIYYHKLPAELGANDVPDFPNALMLVEYIRLRAQEWVHALSAGSADEYLRQKAAELLKAGLAGQSESTSLQLDPRYFKRAGNFDRDTAWMGNV